MSQVAWQRRMAPGLLVAAALLAAGCSAPPAPPEAGDLEALQLEATETTGVIRGLVVDDAIRPIANASVTVRGPGGEARTASTDLDGLVGFEGLAPGTWFVGAGKIAHQDAQASVEVEAGVDDPPLVKLLLVYLPGQAPFLTEAKVAAFVQCIIPGANVCAIANLYPCAVAGYCEPVVEDTSYVLLYDQIVGLQRTPDWLQAEVVWDSTQSLSPKLAIRPSAHSPEDGAGLDKRQDWVYGASPVVMTWNRTRAEEWETGTAEGIAYEIFGHMDETSAVGSIGFVLNQRVDFFFHVFYGYTPPEGWQFSADGSAPPPPV